MKASDVTNLISALTKNTRERQANKIIDSSHAYTDERTDSKRRAVKSTIFGMWAIVGVLVGMNSNGREA